MTSTATEVAATSAAATSTNTGMNSYGSSYGSYGGMGGMGGMGYGGYGGGYGGGGMYGGYGMGGMGGMYGYPMSPQTDSMMRWVQSLACSNQLLEQVKMQFDETMMRLQAVWQWATALRQRAAPSSQGGPQKEAIPEPEPLVFPTAALQRKALSRACRRVRLLTIFFLLFQFIAWRDRRNHRLWMEKASRIWDSVQM
mmetsp:Transcript_36157/g.81838  ORF Transcript_36157/g.81838 Transcript_36157/m.81838 type:complete len:197 (-) Transcript_36157:33-623(-)